MKKTAAAAAAAEAAAAVVAAAVVVGQGFAEIVTGTAVGFAMTEYD